MSNDWKLDALEGLRDLILADANFDALGTRVWVEQSQHATISPSTYPFALLNYQVGTPNGFNNATVKRGALYQWTTTVFVALRNAQSIAWPGPQFAEAQGEAADYVYAMNTLLKTDTTKWGNTISYIGLPGEQGRLFSEEFTFWQWNQKNIMLGILFSIPTSKMLA